MAVLLGVYSNLPWIIGAYYLFTTMMGAALLRTTLPPDLSERLRDMFELSVRSREFWHEWCGSAARCSGPTPSAR